MTFRLSSIVLLAFVFFGCGSESTNDTPESMSDGDSESAGMDAEDTNGGRRSLPGDRGGVSDPSAGENTADGGDSDAPDEPGENRGGSDSDNRCNCSGNQVCNDADECVENESCSAKEDCLGKRICEAEVCTE